MAQVIYFDSIQPSQLKMSGDFYCTLGFVFYLLFCHYYIRYFGFIKNNKKCEKKINYVF